jgi:pimeloyl-ACP methyl ester carboxylesterase
MDGLGYARFGAQGGDIGAGVTSNLGRHFPDRVAGIHVHSDYNWPDPIPPVAELSETERDFLTREARWEEEEGGYSHIQATKPQTLAFGLTDSPVGLAAWIVEKLRGWSDCGGNIERRFTKDEQLTTIMLYWVTQTIASSVRAYYERPHFQDAFGPVTPIRVPAAAAMFPHDFPVPREWVARIYNLRQWNEFDRGGHFAAFEEPELLAADIRAFFRMVR